LNKSELLVSVAQLPESDARLVALFAIMTGAKNPEPVSYRLWGMGQAAKETSLSRVTLWRAIREGRLRAVEVRKGSMRIPDAELRRFVGGK
jgi:excisionase family DNA binding protein